MKNVIEFLHGELTGAHDLLEATTADLTSEQAHHAAGGKTVPIVGHYGHVVIFEDMIINGMLKGGAPLLMSTATGYSELPPQRPPWDVWALKVKTDLSVAHAYARQVFAASDAYIASLDDEALAKPLDLTMLGLGMQSVGYLLGGLVLNSHLHTGEISALKGLQALKGYPI